MWWWVIEGMGVHVVLCLATGARFSNWQSGTEHPATDKMTLSHYHFGLVSCVSEYNCKLFSICYQTVGFEKELADIKRVKAGIV